MHCYNLIKSPEICCVCTADELNLLALGNRVDFIILILYNSNYNSNSTFVVKLPICFCLN